MKNDAVLILDNPKQVHQVGVCCQSPILFKDQSTALILLKSINGNPHKHIFSHDLTPF